MATKLFHHCTTSNSVEVEHMSVETETLCIFQRLGDVFYGFIWYSDCSVPLLQYEFGCSPVSTEKQWNLWGSINSRRGHTRTCLFHFSFASGCTQWCTVTGLPLLPAPIASHRLCRIISSHDGWTSLWKGERVLHRASQICLLLNQRSSLTLKAIRASQEYPIISS